MKCNKCESENVKVETVSNVKSMGGQVPLWYWFGFVWMIDICCLGLIYRGLKRAGKKTKTNVETYAVCQNCGHRWKL